MSRRRGEKARNRAASDPDAVLDRHVNGFHTYRLGDEPRLARVSQSLCALLGATADELLDDGRDAYAAFVHAADRERYADFLARAARCDEAVLCDRYRIVTKDGAVLHVHDTLSVERLRDGSLLGHSTLVDIGALGAAAGGPEGDFAPASVSGGAAGGLPSRAFGARGGGGGPGALREEGRRPDVLIRTFGFFDVFVDGEPIAFRNQKSKELFALLVDRRGGFITSGEAIGFLWENEPSNSVTLARYRKVALRLKNILSEYGIADVVESVNGKRRLVVENVRCDLFDYLTGQAEFAHLFKGSYLSNYSWAETTLAELERDR